MWWEENKEKYQKIEELAINLDGGSATRSNRTQFRKRMIELAQKSGLKIHLIYYPPYHSKYNPIERCWADLENYWNGAILETIESAIEWASNMTWKGINPVVKLIEKTYDFLLLHWPRFHQFLEFFLVAWFFVFFLTCNPFYLIWLQL